jgi:ketosteroid isomerase-like protein
MIRRFSISFILALLAAGPLSAADSAAKQAEAAIRTADQEWSRVFNSKDLEKSVGFCSENIEMLGPNEPRATGREAARQMFAGFFALPELSLNWTPSEIHVAKSVDMAYSTGTYKMSFKDPKGNKIEDHGKYATIWEKQHDGSWKVALDVFNSDVPLPAPAP